MQEKPWNKAGVRRESEKEVEKECYQEIRRYLSNE
jgi:hypothetical protein